MAVYCWGNTAHGELGIGGITNEQIVTPRKLPWDMYASISKVACGQSHTLFLSDDGKLYLCGHNDNEQLGHDLQTKRPQLIKELENYKITQISCGARHSLALTEWGQMFVWGCNDCGQLGLGNVSATTTPKLIKSLISKTIIQIHSGKNHSLALTNCGELYSWGSNMFGQLGVAASSDLMYSPFPRLVTSLNAVPIAHIACGGNHSFVISKSGAVYGWGRNNCGQLGLNDDVSRSYPTQLKTLRSLGVRYISCGDEFSVFLTKEGGVFTCGSGSYGQLGHNNNMNESLPRMVMELMGSTVTQVACGARHTLALVPSRGRLYSFGLGSSGQLGTRNTNNSALPQLVVGPWVSPSGSSLIQPDKTDESAFTIKEIFSGGDHSIVLATHFGNKIPPTDFRVYDPNTQLVELTYESAKECSLIGKDVPLDLDLLSLYEIIFMSVACINGSFLLQDDKHLCCTSKHHGVDLKKAKDAFEYLSKTENESLKHTIWDKVTNELIPSLTASPADVETLRIYLILPLYHEFVNSKNFQKLHTPFSNAVIRLSNVPRKFVCKWWAQTSTEWFEHLVSCYKNVVSHIISFKKSPNACTNGEKRLVTHDTNLLAALNLLVILHRINHKEREDKVDSDIFHWSDLVDYVDIQQEYIHWLFDKNPEAFNICNYPFLFNAAAKTTLLQTDQAMQMHKAMQNAANSGIYSVINYGTASSQFILLNVSRDNIVQDTIREITQYNQNDLKKPLKIKFYGEEAEDAGGVRKEFFMLLLKDLLDPKYGMFKEFEDSRMLWFADVSFEQENEYFLVGIICGLAIYNFTIINVPFPLALYKKLLDETIDLSDLRELAPTLARSLQSILDYDGDDFEKVFDLRFEISRDIFGESKTDLLKAEGDKIKVTQENKEEFVDLYVDFIFNVSVESQFMAFQRGFMKVCWGRVLQLFKPEELMAVVIGNEEYDWQALQSNCEYKNGYTSGDQTVRWFWEIFHDLPESEKKKFLLYLTGSDRIPIQGMKAIKLFIQPTSDDKFLPVAHTCFNLLDLPRYQTKERLKYKLMQAIQQTHGFSLV